MEDFNQNQPQNKPQGGIDHEDKKKGAIIYFLGLIIVAVIAVGYLVLKGVGLF